MTGSLCTNNWKSKQGASFQAPTLNTDPRQHDRQTWWKHTTLAPGGYICYWCTTERATDTDSIISSPGPNDWRGTDFTSTEIPAKTLRQLGELLARRTRSRRKKRDHRGEADKLQWESRAGNPRLISHECSKVAALAFHTLPQPLLFLCFLFSCR